MTSGEPEHHRIALYTFCPNFYILNDGHGFLSTHVGKLDDNTMTDNSISAQPVLRSPAPSQPYNICDNDFR